MTKATYHFLRHVPPAQELYGTLYGGGEIPIDTTSNETVSRLHELAVVLPKDAQWASSPVPRAITTCKLLQDIQGRLDTIVIINDFAEQDFGDFVGQTHEVLRSNKEFQNYKNDFANVAPPNGESFKTFQERVLTGLGALTTQFETGDVIVGAHGGTIRAILSALTATNIENIVKNTPVQPLAKLSILFDGQQFKIADFNQGLMSTPLTHPAQLK